MTKIYFLVVCVIAQVINVRTSTTNPKKEETRQLAVLPEECLAKNRVENCTSTKRYFYFDAENRTCNQYDGCEDDNRKNRFSSAKICLDTCLRGQRKPTRRCQQQLKGKAPERCRWIKAIVDIRAGCPKYQLQCTGGPCSTRPCRAPCEICTYNLEFTVRNCSLVTRIDGDGEECPPPFRCERDIRCKNDLSDASTIAPSLANSISNSSSSSKPPASPKITSPKSASPAPTELSVALQSTSQSPPEASLTTSATSTSSATSSCFLPVKYNACTVQDVNGNLVWYFDLQSKLCRRFYGTQTCSGNANGFRTKEECVRVCHSHRECPLVARNPLPVGCRYEERRTLDGCLVLAMVCSEKPGRCPIPTGKATYNICYKECDRDADCKDEMKCCANGCASLCLAPAPSLLHVTTKSLSTALISNSSTTTTPLSLSVELITNSPTIKPLSEPLSVTLISDNEIIESNRTKAGACPKEKRRRPGDQQRCTEKCNVDDDCLGSKKCCSSIACGRVCRSPTEASPARLHPCSNSPCPPTERCTPISPVSLNSKRSDFPDLGYLCEPIELAAFDPCISGKNTCGSEDTCVYEPKMCLIGPCPQYRCLPNPPPGFRRKGADGSNVKRRAEIPAVDQSNDPCSLNPCRPCQRCVPTDIDEGKEIVGESKESNREYRCENTCPNQCEECTLSGRCVVINPPYICRTNKAVDPCQNRTCDAHPTAKCFTDPCHCLRVRFVQESGAEISPDECRLTPVALFY